MSRQTKICIGINKKEAYTFSQRLGSRLYYLPRQHILPRGMMMRQRSPAPNYHLMCRLMYGLIFWSGTIVCALATPAMANAASYTGSARVVKATPIISRSVSNVPIKRCTWEALPSRTKYYPEYNERRVTERHAKRCRTSYESRPKQNITGYDVTLEYNGERFERQTDVHPGTRMSVSIDIAPLPR